jgi:ubiquinone/menaquinone biosynthesis C-methylase UbiE
MNILSFQYKLQKLYWDANSFFWDDYLFKTGMKDEFTLLSEYLTKKMNKLGARVLDIGCATGSLSIALAEKGFNVTGVDFSSYMIKNAKNKIIAKRDLRIFFINADVNKQIPFQENEFDLIICRHSFNSVLNKKIFIEKIKLVTASNGLVLISGKCSGISKKKYYKKGFIHSLVRLVKPIVFRNRDDKISRKEVTKLFQQNNFKLMDEQLTDHNYSLLFSISK